MSISYLTSPNDFNLYAKSLTVSEGVNTPSDIPWTTLNLDLFNGSNVYINNGVILNYIVKGGYCYVLINQTANVTMGANNELNLTIANSDTGYFYLPPPAATGEDIRGSTHVYTNTGFVRDCYLFLDANAGGPGNGRIVLYLTPSFTVAGNVATKVPNSDLFNNQVTIYSFEISYPVDQ